MADTTTPNAAALTAQLSKDGKAMIDRVVRMRQSPEFLTFRLMEARALPNPDKVESIDIQALRQVLAERAVSVEQRMSEMLAAIHMTPRKNESPDDRYHRNTAKTTAIRSMEHTVEVSRDPYELDTAARMFLDQRSIIVKLAQNPYLSEATIINIANNAFYKNDSQIGRTLAQNHNITPKAARAIATNYKNNQFVMHALADNVGKQARVGADRAAFAQVCKELTAAHPINFPLAPAILGVNDPHHLRALYDQHSKRPVIERNLDHTTYHAIAQNPHTPIEVIHRMSQEPPLTSIFGKESSVTHDTIQQRLSAMTREPQHVVSTPDTTPRPN